LCPACLPCQALDMYRGFSFFLFFFFFFFFFFFVCGCKWSYFTPPFSCHRTFHVLLKGMLVVSPSVRFPALPPFPTCPLAALCLAVPFPRMGPQLSNHLPQAFLPREVGRDQASVGPFWFLGVLLP
jgi:hypothetical protein